MSDDERPDPERLYRAMRKDRRKDSLGELRIFFGMAAGVGKTYSMLQAAQQKKAEGVDVVIGIIHTHGRSEVARLAEDLERVPEREVSYRGAIFKELNLNAIILRKPQLVLVDELAHTNVPGSRHPYRWQDILDLLQAGINVYTTVNVQHLESRKEIVENITGIAIRETIPDSIIELASEIKLVDLSPADLLQRLKEGKVYLGEKSTVAAENFFKEDSLTALREIALRFTAEKVDLDLQELLASRKEAGDWKASERLMVAVSHSPFSQQLIRATRRLAFNLKAPWIAVHIDSGIALNTDDSNMLAKNLSLARQLGAEVLTTADPDIAAALQRLAIDKRVSQIVVGRPLSTPIRDLLSGGSLVDRIMQQIRECDIHVVRQEPIPGISKPKWLRLPVTSPVTHYWMTAAYIAFITVLNVLLLPWVGYKVAGLFYIIALMYISLFVSKGPILLGALLASLIWDFYFIPPSNSFDIPTVEEAVLMLVFFAVAATGGLLTSRIRMRESMLRRRERRSQSLYEVMREIATIPKEADLLHAISERLGTLLNGTVGIALKSDQDELELEVPSPVVKNEKERAVAVWVLHNGQPAGWSTETLASVGVLYLPVRGSKDVMGVLAYRPKRLNHLSLEEMSFLGAVTQQLAVSVERYKYQRKELQGEHLRQIDNLHNAILTSISTELRAPLDIIKGAVSAVAAASTDDERRKVTRLLQDSANDLDMTFNNLIELSQLSSGFLAVQKDYQNIGDILQSAIQTLGKQLQDYDVKVNITEELPYLYVDSTLMELVIANILMNAVAVSPKNTQIFMEASQRGSDVVISISDQGPGIPQEALGRLFEKFFRIPGSSYKGLGLGLAVAKAIVEMHFGRIEVNNRPEGGAVFSVFLPVEPPHRR